MKILLSALRNYIHTHLFIHLKWIEPLPSATHCAIYVYVAEGWRGAVVLKKKKIRQAVSSYSFQDSRES